MKILEVLSEAAGLKKPKKRPNKTLWYNHSGYWKNDLNLSRPGYCLHSEENEESIYAMDPKTEYCYGAWYPKKNKGVTFATPRPKHVLISPRTRIRPYLHK